MGPFSTYKLYKQGTSQVVAWLGKTAARFGYEWGSGSADKSTLEKQPKKKTSKSNDAKANGVSKGQDASYIVSTKELPVLARVISEHFHQMPDSKALQDILKVLKDVITKRKQWASTFKLPDEGTLTNNMRHKHFVNVLEDVYQILGGSMSALQVEPVKGQASAEAEAIGESKSTSSDAIALSNLFAVLDIEEPADQADAVPGSAKTPSSSRPNIITYELEDEMNLEELYFMIYCFFEDFQAVRKHVAQGWANYKSGLLDLISVATMTNVALETLQRAETTLLESFPNEYRFALDGYENIAGLIVKAVALSRGVDPSFLHRRDDVINMDLKDISEFVCTPVYILISSFTTSVLGAFGRDLPVMKKGFYGNIDYSGKKMSWREKFVQDKIVLLEFLPEFCFLKEVKIATPVLDELSSGLVEMTRTRKIPIWLLFGCQIYLDIHHTMLSGMNKALQDLKTMGRHVSTTLEKYLNFSKGMSIETWPEENDKFVRLIKLEADLWVNRDFLSATRKKVFEKFNPPIAATESHSILSRQPILCGIMLLRLSLKLHDAGVTLVSAWGSLPSVIHLYNAVKHESRKESFPVWQDAESVIEIQGVERVFVGSCPKDLEAYFKSFCLVFGHTASMFAQNRRALNYTPDNLKRSLASSRGPRAMIVTSTIADILRGQYCEQTRFEVTIHKLEELFSTSLNKKKFGTRRKDQPFQFTSVFFLSALQAHIQSEILALDMDYFALHMRCWDLLREIHVKLDSEFRQIGPEYVEKESQLPFLVGYLFRIALASKPASKRIILREADQGVLRKAGDLVKQLVQKEGDKEVDRVRSVYTGYDWEHPTPDFEDLPPLEPIRRKIVDR